MKPTCPLGKKCETCKWYVLVRGKHPQSEQQIDEWNCAMAWIPILLIENAQTSRGQTQALESFRNEMVKGQNQFHNILIRAAERKYIDEK